MVPTYKPTAAIQLMNAMLKKNKVLKIILKYRNTLQNQDSKDIWRPMYKTEQYLNLDAGQGDEITVWAFNQHTPTKAKTVPPAPEQTTEESNQAGSIEILKFQTFFSWNQ